MRFTTLIASAHGLRDLGLRRRSSVWHEAEIAGRWASGSGGRAAAAAAA
jgi:hypothetical protein